MGKAWGTFGTQREGHRDWKLGSKSFNSLWEEMGSSPRGHRTCPSCLDTGRCKTVYTQDAGCRPCGSCILTVRICFPAWIQSRWTSIQQRTAEHYDARGTSLQPKYQLTRMSWHIISKTDSLPVKAQNTTFWLRQYSMSGTSWVL